MENGYLKQRLSRQVAHQNMKKQRMNDLRWVQNRQWLRPDGIGGEFACPLPQIANGGPKAKGAAQPVYGFPQADVDVSPPRDPGVMNRNRKESGTE